MSSDETWYVGNAGLPYDLLGRDLVPWPEPQRRGEAEQALIDAMRADHMELWTAEQWATWSEAVREREERKQRNAERKRRRKRQKAARRRNRRQR